MKSGSKQISWKVDHNMRNVSGDILRPSGRIHDERNQSFLKTAVQQYIKSYKFCSNSCLSAKENNYDLLFNSKSTSNYATYSSLPSMTCLTACLWMRTSYSGTHYFFSYSTSSYYDALSLGYDSGEAEIDFNINYPSWRWAFVYRWYLGDILAREPLVCKSMYPSRPCRNRLREEKKLYRN